ncbi:MAG: Tad domain-containing protein [Planctomycetia bacterium]|nr:Tad domain-containing protein [Planctomycetia bacterium]
MSARSQSAVRSPQRPSARRPCAARAQPWFERLHRNQDGTISILSVFGLMILAMVLAMVINVSRQADHKVKMQNAADASAYSGGLVLARGMNTLAFTNHLLSDVFALTAYMREARDRNSQRMVPEVLAAWNKAAGGFSSSQFPKLKALSSAVKQKVPLEQALVDTFSAWASSSSELILPALEKILAEELISEFQRALVVTTPELAQLAADEIARQHGLGRQGINAQGGMALGGMARGGMALPVNPLPPAPSGSRSASPVPVRNMLPTSKRSFRAVLWRTIADPVGGRAEGQRRTLPVVDPVMDSEPNQQDYVDRARQQRYVLARQYLTDWNSETLNLFELEAKMSQFRWIWEGFTCGQLHKLLNDEYPDRNLPFVIRTEVEEIGDVNEHLEMDFMFVGVVYSDDVPEMLPGLFRDPMQHHTQTHAQILLFVPQARLVKGVQVETQGGGSIGGVPMDTIDFNLDGTQQPAPQPGEQPQIELIYRQNRPMGWNALNQNWTVQLVPARAGHLGEILSTRPDAPHADARNLRLPRLSHLKSEDINDVNNH